MKILYLLHVGAVIKDAIGFEKLGTLRLYKVWHIENNGYCLNKKTNAFLCVGESSESKKEMEQNKSIFTIEHVKRFSQLDPTYRASGFVKQSENCL